MPKSISVGIGGDEAARALDELLAIPGIRGSADPSDASGPTRDGGLLAATATIVGIIGGAVAIAAQIIAWRDQWKKRAGATRLDAILEDAKGNRVILDNATLEEVTAALETLAA